MVYTNTINALLNVSKNLGRTPDCFPSNGTCYVWLRIRTTLHALSCDHSTTPGLVHMPLQWLHQPVQIYSCKQSLTALRWRNDERVSQITSLTIVCSTVYSGSDQRKDHSSASLAFVLGIHRWPVNSPHKGPVTRKMFPFDDIIMEGKWINSWQHSTRGGNLENI